MSRITLPKVATPFEAVAEMVPMIVAPAGPVLIVSPTVPMKAVSTMPR